MTFRCSSRLSMNSNWIYNLLTRECNATVSNLKHFTTHGNTQNGTVFSGMQPTGIPHLGNYIGAIKQWVHLQNLFNCTIYSIVDLHSFTTVQEPRALRQNTFELAASLLASGIDPQKAILFPQSQVPQHVELSWILGCLTSMQKLQHLPQWKEKAVGIKEVPFGIFTYPVLQAADILLYKATDVPVGDDQVKHIELTRALAMKFNKTFGKVFPVPNVLKGNFPRIKSLRDPASKMSKSCTDIKSRINLTDSSDTIHSKLKKAVTDSVPIITYEPETRPGISNLIEIHAALADITTEEVCKLAEHMDTVNYKNHLTGVISEHLKPIREEIQRLQNDQDYIRKLLELGTSNAKVKASKTFTEVKNKIGLMV